MAASKLLEYFPFSSSVNPSFWNKLTEIKLDIDKLEESGKHIWGYYSNFVINNCGTPLFEVDSTSYNKYNFIRFFSNKFLLSFFLANFPIAMSVYLVTVYC